MKIQYQIIITAIITSIAISMSWANNTPKYDIYGGWTGLQGKATGYFHTQKIHNRWWLITPKGNVFISIGCTGLRWDQVGDAYENNIRHIYGTSAKYYASEVSRLKKWGFNTLGAWAAKDAMKQHIPYAINAQLGLKAMGTKIFQVRGFPDVFSKHFTQAVDQQAREICSLHRKDPYCIGYWSDNELVWYHRVWAAGQIYPISHRVGLVEWYLGFRNGILPDSAGRQAIVAFFKKRYHNNWASFSTVWQTDVDGFNQMAAHPNVRIIAKHPAQAIQDRQTFLDMVAHRYFGTVSGAIRKYDPNHLYLGVRFAISRTLGGPSYTPERVMDDAMPYVDVMTANVYSNSPFNHQGFMYLVARCRKPILIGEFSIRAATMGVSNDTGQSPVVANQAQRAAMAAQYIRELIRIPTVVGYHWFRWVDRPAANTAHKRGRFSGNYGLVQITDHPWSKLTQTLTRVNHHIYQLAQQPLQMTMNIPEPPQGGDTTKERSPD